MPSLNVACVSRMNSFSSICSIVLNSAIIGIVASPTPIVPISSDSTSVMSYLPRSTCDERRRGHPSGCAAAHDHDVQLAGFIHA